MGLSVGSSVSCSLLSDRLSDLQVHVVPPPCPGHRMGTFTISCCVVAQSCPALSEPARLFCPCGFSRQEYWSGLLCPPPGYLPNPRLLHFRQILYSLSYQGSPISRYHQIAFQCNSVAVSGCSISFIHTCCCHPLTTSSNAYLGISFCDEIFRFLLVFWVVFFLSTCGTFQNILIKSFVRYILGILPASLYLFTKCPLIQTWVCNPPYQLVSAFGVFKKKRLPTLRSRRYSCGFYLEAWSSFHI